MPKGQTPWNKGKKTGIKPWQGKYRSEKTKRKISQTLKEKGIKPPSNSGKKFSLEVRKKMSNSRMGEKNFLWKGEMVGYHALHAWVHRQLGKPQICESCGREKDFPKGMHWANVDHKYKRDLEDFIALCPSCHKEYDKNLKRYD